MRTIIALIATCSLLFASKKVNQSDKYYKTTTTSNYTIGGKTYAIKDIQIRTGMDDDSTFYFVDAYYYGNPINKEKVKGDLTIRLYTMPKEGTKTYAVENALHEPSNNPDSVAIRYDVMKGVKPPEYSVVSIGKKGESVTVTKHKGKLVITSKGITMMDGKKLAFNIGQQ
jgi:hypothetical protein